MVGQLVKSASEKSPQSGTKTIAARYLSAAHRDDPSDGCPLAALGSEIARGDEKTRAAGTQAFLRLVDVIAGQFSNTPPKIAEGRALGGGCTIVGAGTLG